MTTASAHHSAAPTPTADALPDDATPAPDESPDDREEDGATTDDQTSRFKKSVAMLLAALAILGGMIAVLETYASTSESQAAREATRAAVSGLAAQVEANALQQVTTELAATPELRERAQTETAALQLEATAQDLRRSALTQTRIGWNSRASQFGTVVTVLAIAVFLTGFALVVQTRIRIPVVVPGIVLGLVCAGWAVQIHLRGVPDTAERAIDATASGLTAMERGDYAAARASFDEAIRIDADYPAAHEGRGVSTFLDANPDFFAVGSVLDNSESVRASARADLDRALEIGPDHNVYAQTLIGILDLYGPDPAAATEALDQALRLDPSAPELWFAHAAARTAAGDIDEAESSLESGLDLLDQRRPSDSTRQLAAEALTSFEWVRVRGADGESASRLARRIVALEASFIAGRELRPEQADATTLIVEQASFEDGRLHFDVSLDVPDDTVLSALVYERASPDAPWAQSPELGMVAVVTGKLRIDESIVVDRACLPVEFRLDLHAEAVLVEQVLIDGAPEPTCVDT